MKQKGELTSLQCSAFIFGLTCHHKVHWAQLINSYEHGTWHVVGRLHACDASLRLLLRLISKIVMCGSYIGTQFL